MSHRLDRLGRRIGHNPWRDWITDCWRSADHAWWSTMEAETSLYDTEVREWRADNPRPRLGDFMVSLAPGWTRERVETLAWSLVAFVAWPAFLFLAWWY